MSDLAAQLLATVILCVCFAALGVLYGRADQRRRDSVEEERQ